MAESMAQASGSWWDGKTKRSVAAYTLSTSETNPGNLTDLSSPSCATSCLQAGFFRPVSRDEQDALWKLRAQLRKSAKEDARVLFRGRGPRRCRGIRSHAKSRNGCARGHDPPAKPRDGISTPTKITSTRSAKASRCSHGFLHEIRYRDDAAGRAIPRQGKGIRGERKFHAARNNHGNETVRPRQPCGGECVRFVSVNDIHPTTSHQSADRACSGKAPEFLGDFMDDGARLLLPCLRARNPEARSIPERGRA